MVQELRYALRSLLKTPGFAASAVILLAIGIAANSTIFSIVNGVLLRPLPGIGQADRLVMIGKAVSGRSWAPFQSFPDFRDLADLNKTFSAVAAHDWTPMSLSEGKRTDRVYGSLASGKYFQVLGVNPILGRLPTVAEDSVPDRDAVAVISEHLWAGRWNRNPDVIGKAIALDGHPFTIIGVAGGRFRGMYIDQPSDVWIPLAMHSVVGGTAKMREARDGSWLLLTGRLKDKQTLAQARAELASIGHQLAAAYPKENKDKQFVADLYSPSGGQKEVAVFFSIMSVGAGLAMLIICANVANLLIARATARRRDFAIRASLGAGRTHLVRHMLLEGLLLSFAAVAVGLTATLWTTEAVRTLFPETNGIEYLLDFRPDAAVVLFSIGVAVACTLVFALGPSIASSKLNLVSALKAGEPTVSSGRSRLRSSLVVVQVAVGLVLIVGSGLLARTYHNLKSVDPRVKLDGLLLVSVSPEANGYDEARGRRVMNSILERVSQAPGVNAAALGFMVPFGDSGFSIGAVRLRSAEPPMRVDMNVVSPAYFKTLGIPLLRGRDFRATDTKAAPRVVIVNETLARQLWPSEEPIGKTLLIGDEKALWEVVGVAQKIRYRSARDDDRTFLYLPAEQSYLGRTVIHASAANPLTLVEPIRQAVRDVDPNLPTFDIRTLRVQFERSLWTDRLAFTLLGSLGVVACVVAAIGLYAVMAFHVARRTREIGIRMALGASVANVVRDSLRHGLVLTGTGAALGMILSYGATRALGMLLYGVAPGDPLTFAAGAGLLMVTAALACYVPVRRAAAVDPIQALRYE